MIDTSIDQIIDRYEKLGLTIKRDGKTLLTHFAVVEQDDETEEAWEEYGSLEALQQIAIETRGIPEEKVADKASFKDRLLRFVASDDSKDRYGDRITVDGKLGKKVFGEGWKLDQFERNPVFMPFHEYERLPLGVALKTFKDVRPGRRKALRTAVLMDDGEGNPLSPVMTKAYRNGLMRGNSVGFMPLDVHIPEGEEERSTLGLGKSGVVFGTQELWEDSAVSIPANPGALAENSVDCTDMKCFLRFADEARDVDPEFGYRVRSMIRSGLGQVYLNDVEKAIEDETENSADTSVNVALTIDSSELITDLVKELRDARDSLQEATDRMVSIARALDAQLAYLRDGRGSGTDPEPVLPKSPDAPSAHVIEAMLELGRETQAIIEGESE